jgi:hypothetical protein
LSESEQKPAYELDKDLNPVPTEETKRKKKFKKNEADQELEDVRKILDTEHGRRFLWKYMAECGIFQSIMRTDQWIYFLEGKRSVGLKMLAEVMTADKEKYLLMANEAEHRNKQKRKL